MARARSAHGGQTPPRRVIYGATPNGSALCCDATLVSPRTRTGQPQPCTADVDSAALRAAERRKAATCPELRRQGPQKLLVLGSEVGGRRRAATGARPGPTGVLQSAASPARRRVFRLDASLVGHAVCRSAAGALGQPWPQPPQATSVAGPPLDRVPDLAEAEGPAATLVVVVGPRRLRRTPSLTGHKVGRSKRA